MTWYASQIIAEARPPVRQLLLDSPTLADHVYWVNHLEGHHWPQPPVDRHWLKHGLPAAGLLIVRELCQPGTPEFTWQDNNAVAWDKLTRADTVPFYGYPISPPRKWERCTWIATGPGAIPQLPFSSISKC